MGHSHLFYLSALSLAMNHDALMELMKKKLNVVIEKRSPALKINLSALLEYLYLLSVGDHYSVTTFNTNYIME